MLDWLVDWYLQHPNDHSRMLHLGERLLGAATFPFDFFQPGAFLGYRCNRCQADQQFRIEIYRSGKLVAGLLDEPDGPALIDQLLEKGIINRKEENNRLDAWLSPYILWRMDAHYERFRCSNCASEHLAIFGMTEIQPSREEVQFKGIFALHYTDS